MYSSATIKVKFTSIGSGIQLYLYGGNGDLDNKEKILDGQPANGVTYEFEKGAEYDMIIVAVPSGSSDTDFEFEYSVDGKIMNWIEKFYKD